jgi:hypothetical protein
MYGAVPLIGSKIGTSEQTEEPYISILRRAFLLPRVSKDAMTHVGLDTTRFRDLAEQVVSRNLNKVAERHNQVMPKLDQALTVRKRDLKKVGS